MFKGTFQFGNEIFNVIIDKNNVMYEHNGVISTIEGLKLDRQGTLKEFPDLNNDEEWRKKAIERLKEHMKTFKTEKEKLDYVKEELTKFGNKALMYQQAGFRPKKW